MREQFLIFTLGLNIPGYWRYDQIALSVVSYSTSIESGETEISIADEEVDQKDAEFAVAYAVDAVLQMENLVGDLEEPFGSHWA